jgi:hypothetical protein
MCSVSGTGIAYVTGAGWIDQFVSKFAEQAAYLTGADRDNAAIVGVWGPHPSVSLSMCPAQYAAAATILMIGDFQAPTPPAIPGVPVGNSILLATAIESGDAPALCERSVA